MIRILQNHDANVCDVCDVSVHGKLYVALLSAPTFQQRQQSLSTSFDGKLH